MEITINVRRIEGKKRCVLMMNEENINESGVGDNGTPLLDDEIAMGRLITKKEKKE